eukprot:2054304-Rhodomonas_salina.1
MVAELHRAVGIYRRFVPVFNTRGTLRYPGTRGIFIPRVGITYPGTSVFRQCQQWVQCTFKPILGICTSALTTISSRKELPQAVPTNNGTTSSTAAMWCGV